jgi:hypothetical protein
VSDDTRPDDPEARRRHLIRLAAGVVALVLVMIAATLLLANRHPARSADAYCRKLAEGQSLADALADGDAQEIRTSAAHFRSSAEVAPPEIRAQAQILVDYADELTATLATAGGSEAETRAALADAVRRMQDRSSEVVTAGQAVDAYARDSCHLEPGTTTPGG